MANTSLASNGGQGRTEGPATKESDGEKGNGKVLESPFRDLDTHCMHLHQRVQRGPRNSVEGRTLQSSSSIKHRLHILTRSSSR